MSLDTGLLAAGAVLILIELIIPGFGLFGIAGLLSLIAGFFFFFGGGWDAFMIVAGAVAVLGLLTAFFFWYLPSDSVWNPFVLRDKQKNDAGYTGADDYSALVGKRGEAITPLRPAGTALVDGQRLDVVSFGDYIDKGAAIEIVKTEGSKLLVKQLNKD